MPYLPYEEPGITTTLSLISFILLLNAARYVFDRLLYCGIIGEILIGVIWGLPIGGTAWLTHGMQESVQSLGYLGLIGLVFEGGLSIDLNLLRKTAMVSVSIATIGLCVPIALSFLLLFFPFSTGTETLYPTPLAAFSAGAALCSTSLGTTFAILSSAGLQKTRIGVILVGAAIMDDVVGLVMVNVITTVGSGIQGGWTIARPIVSSFGLLLVTLALAHLVLRPVWRWMTEYLTLADQDDGELAATPNVNSKTSFQRTIGNLVRRIPHISFVLCIATLIVFVTIAAFIDASVLFAAFIAGGIVNFLWDVQKNGQQPQSTPPEDKGSSQMYNTYFHPTMEIVLVPFFFASIGFSIPIRDMFTGPTVWKGVVYSLLMAVAKASVGIVIYLEYFIRRWARKPTSRGQVREPPQSERETKQSTTTTGNSANTRSKDEISSSGPPHTMAMLAGFGMIARGEIGFLIASLSQSSNTLGLQHPGGPTQSSNESLFLVIIWAIVICTILGPISMGIIARRLRQGNIHFS